MARVTATGIYDGKQVTVSCVEDGRDILVSLNGMENERTKTILDMYAKEREAKYYGTHAYSAPHGTIEAYWLALHEGFFDKAPDKVMIEGAMDIVGAPYDDSGQSVYKDSVF